MVEKFILTAFCKDRPGIVADITETIYENGCNLERFTMTSMLDEFAIILLFSGNKDGLEAQLLKDCRRLERDKGITAFLKACGRKRKKGARKNLCKDYQCGRP